MNSREVCYNSRVALGERGQGFRPLSQPIGKYEEYETASGGHPTKDFEYAESPSATTIWFCYGD